MPPFKGRVQHCSSLVRGAMRLATRRTRRRFSRSRSFARIQPTVRAASPRSLGAELLRPLQPCQPRPRPPSKPLGSPTARTPLMATCDRPQSPRARPHPTAAVGSTAVVGTAPRRATRASGRTMLSQLHRELHRVACGPCRSPHTRILGCGVDRKWTGRRRQLVQVLSRARPVPSSSTSPRSSLASR